MIGFSRRGLSLFSILSVPNLPPALPETGKFAKLYAWLNQLRDAVIALRPVQSLNVRSSHTAMGVSRQANPSAGDPGTPSNKPVWLP